MSSTTIIGLGYKARRGKDTVAQAIVDARGGQYDIRRYAFADALKEEFIEALGNPDDPFWKFVEERTGEKVSFGEEHVTS